MDAFMKNMERLAVMAAGRPDPKPLDAASVTALIRGIRPEDDGMLAMPLGYFAGGAAAAAAIAVTVGALAVMAWMDMSNPFTGVDSLLDVTEYML